MDKKKGLINKKYKFLLKLITTISLLFILFDKVNFEKVVDSFGRINFLFVLPILLYPVGIFISTLKWKKSLNENLNFWKLFKIYWISNFFSNFLPSTIGGDSYKLVKLRKFGVKNIFVSVLLDRGSGVFSIFLLILIISFFSSILFLDKLFFLMGVSLLLIFLIFLKFPIKNSRISKYQETIIKNKNRFLYLIFLSVLFLLLGGLSFWIYFYMFGLNLNFINLFSIYLLVQIISMIPISLNGWGLSELSLVSLVSFLGVAPEIALAIALVSRFAGLIASGFGGILFLFEKNKEE